MLPRIGWNYIHEMSFPHGSTGPTGGMEDYMENLDPTWANVEASPFLGVSHPYSTGAHPSATILTPMSLPDSTFNTRPSPVLSQHSQEYPYHRIGEPVAHHGLGISAPFPGDFPGPASSSFGFPQGGEIDYNPAQATRSIAPQRTRHPRRVSKTAPTARDTPVTILPHPEGLQRLEQERLHGQLMEAHSREPQTLRATGRGRRNPQAEEEDDFVENLREQNVAWKVVAERFRERFNRDSSEARLQMRLQRRRKGRSAMWDADDIQLLLRAHDYWQNEKYKIIAQKMQELGAKRAYTEQECEAQLQIEVARTPESSRVPPPRIPDPQHRRKRARRRTEAEGD